MTEPSYILLEGTATKMIWELTDELESEWHTADDHHRLVHKIDRLERFKKYVRLHKQFTPKPSDFR